VSLPTLLSRLDKVRTTGQGRYVACCPAHDDKTPSLAITELPDGRILIHCFAECPPDAILGAVGLEFDALYPEQALGHAVRSEKPWFNARDVLTCLANESLIVYLCAKTLNRGEALIALDQERLRQAVTRLGAAHNML
jgi:hypothetical protein